MTVCLHQLGTPLCHHINRINNHTLFERHHNLQGNVRTQSQRVTMGNVFVLMYLQYSRREAFLEPTNKTSQNPLFLQSVFCHCPIIQGGMLYCSTYNILTNM